MGPSPRLDPGNLRLLHPLPSRNPEVSFQGFRQGRRAFYGRLAGVAPLAATWRRPERQRASLAGNRSPHSKRPSGATQAKSGEPPCLRAKSARAGREPRSPEPAAGSGVVVIPQAQKRQWRFCAPGRRIRRGPGEARACRPAPLQRGGSQAGRAPHRPGAATAVAGQARRSPRQPCPTVPPDWDLLRRQLGDALSASGRPLSGIQARIPKRPSGAIQANSGEPPAAGQ